MNESQPLRIISVARALATQDGMEAVTVRKVAKAAGIGPSTLRYYFPTQEALHTEVIRREFDDTLSDLDIQNSARPALERLVECLLQFLPTDEHDIDVIKQLPGAATSVSSHGGQNIANHSLDLATQQARVRVRHWLDVLHEEGLFSTRPSDAKVTVLCALVNGLSIDLTSRAPSIGLEEVASVLEDAVQRLMMNPPLGRSE